MVGHDDLIPLLTSSPGSRRESAGLERVCELLAKEFTERGLSCSPGRLEGSACLEIELRLSFRLAIVAQLRLPLRLLDGRWELSFQAFVANVLYLDEPIALMTPVVRVSSLDRMSSSGVVELAVESLRVAHREFQQDLLIEEPSRPPV